MDHSLETIDCACVIHGDAYPWSYVEKLHGMLSRHLSKPFRLHVYTEAFRSVPGHMIKHDLEDFGRLGPRQVWWYKMQLFNTNQHSGPLLYFDLDTVIVNNIDWIWQLPPEVFWAVRDFKQLWKPSHCGINSSVMWWDTRRFGHIWTQFKSGSLQETMRAFPGDQDYITRYIPETQRRFFEPEFVQSWRWQCKDGGYDFRGKRHVALGTGTAWPQATSIVLFHGRPKPHEITDPVIQQHWK